jgi:hypothetical protein
MCVQLASFLAYFLFWLGTLKLKDDVVSFLRAHIHQISEKLPKSLPPSQEEAKKKGWWQFWKR